jgi:hypothetical protein
VPRSQSEELSTQIAEIRDAVREEFSALRGGPSADAPSLTSLRDEFTAIRGGERGPDMPSLRSLTEDISSLGETLRNEMRENADQIMAQVRVLHEDLIARIAVLGGAPKRNRRR